LNARAQNARISGGLFERAAVSFFLRGALLALRFLIPDY
jgi:hypothetical protein